jgi:membrane-associated phospholipid phosphatase
MHRDSNMRWVRTVADEVFGLFVDDSSFAVAILAWILLVWIAVSRVGVGMGWAAAGLFLGLAAILAESVGRRARR